MSRSHSRKGTSQKVQTVTLILVLVSLFYLGYVGGFIRHYEWNPSSTIRLSERLYNESGQYVFDDGLIIHTAGGYDGKEYFTLAHDLDNDVVKRKPNRHQRIGYPVLIWALSFGNTQLFPIMSILIVIGAIVAGTYVSMKILEHYKRNIWWSVVYALNPVFLIGSIHNLIEPISVLGYISTLYFLIVKKPWLGSLTLAATMFLREDACMFAFLLGTYYFFKKGSLWERIERSLPIVVATIPWIFWEVYLMLRYQEFFLGGSNFTYPIVGMIVGAMNMKQHHLDAFGTEVLGSKLQFMVTTYSAVVLMVFLVVCLVVGIMRYYEKRTLMNHLFLFHTFFLLCINSNIWITSLPGPTRIAYIIFPYLLVSYAEKPHPLLRYMLYYSLGITFIIFVGQQVFPVLSGYYIL